MKSETLLAVCVFCSIALVLALPKEYDSYIDMDLESDDALQDTQKLSELVSQWRKALTNVRRRSQSSQQQQQQQQRTLSPSSSATAARSSKIAVNKRHCWDVADVCCMWNIC